MNALRATTIYRAIAAGAVLAAIVAAYRLLAPANPTTVALTLLLYILVLAAWWGLRYAVVASLIAAACFNFFFLPPIDTFTIAETQNWVALFAFLGTAIIASQLSGRIQAQARQAKARQAELEILFELSRALLQTDKVAELLPAIPGFVLSAARATSVVLYVERGDQLFHTADVGSEDMQGIEPRAAMHLTEVRTSDSTGWTILPVRTGIRPRGLLLIRGVTASKETFESLARLVSIAIDRAEALEEAARIEATKESERLRMVLLDSVTHELRTPLTAIKASATALLSTQHVSRENQIEMLTVINEESDRLNRLIAQAMQMGQLDSADMQMEFAPCQVRDLVERAIESCSYSLARHHLKIDIPEDCPPVLADCAWIERALINLFVNAAKYSPQGTEIAVSASDTGQFVAISVTDDGVGIDPAEQEMIFERFYRGQNSRDRVSGTGMGLAICRAVVEAHHGSIRVENVSGHGAKFTVMLPVVQTS